MISMEWPKWGFSGVLNYITKFECFSGFSENYFLDYFEHLLKEYEKYVELIEVYTKNCGI